MDPWTALSYILLGIALGIIGQLIRVGVGIKKLYDDAQNSGKDFNEIFDKNRLLLSIGIAIVIGATAGALGIIQYAGQDVTREMLLALMSMGYAGTDFIEGILTKQNLQIDQNKQTEADM